MDHEAGKVVIQTLSRIKRKYRDKGVESTSNGGPKRALNAYFLYYKETCNSARERGETISPNEVHKNWTLLPEENKARLREEANKGFEDYRSHPKEVRNKQEKPKLETRCAPRKLLTLFSLPTFDSRKRQFITEMGFGTLLDIRCGKLRRSLCLDLVKRFDPYTCTLQVHGQTLKLGYEEVGQVLGLPAEGTELITEGSNTEIKQICEDLNIKHVKRDVLLSDIERDLGQDHIEEREFKAKLMLYLIGWFLSPTTSLTVSYTYLFAISNVEKINKVNWSKFVFDSLVRGVREYKSNYRVGISGCVFFLMAYYLSIIDVGIRDTTSSQTDHSALTVCGDSETSKILQAVEKLGGLDSTRVKVLRVEMSPAPLNMILDPMSSTTQTLDRVRKMEVDMESLKEEVADLKATIQSKLTSTQVIFMEEIASLRRLVTEGFSDRDRRGVNTSEENVVSLG